MPSAATTPSTRAADRLQGWATALRGWRSSQGRVARWLIPAVGIATLLIAGYALTTIAPSAKPTPLFDGRRFANQDADAITAALTAAQIPSVRNALGQITVPGSRVAEAVALLMKQKLAPARLRDLRNEPGFSPWDTPDERESRLNRSREQQLEYLIGKVPGVAAADVWLNQIKPRGREPVSVKARVLLHPTPGTPVSPRALGTIQTIFAGEQGIRPDGITILDDEGTTYVLPGETTARAESAARARETELQQDLLRELSWIGGVRVHVSFDVADVAAPRAEPKTSAEMSVNEPLVSAQAGAANASQPLPRKAQVLVQVPFEYYSSRIRDQDPSREPKLEELKALATKTDERIRMIVRSVVPRSELESLTISRHDEALPARPSALLGGGAVESTRNWLIAATIGVAAVFVAAWFAWSSRRAGGSRSRRESMYRQAPPAPHFEVDEFSEAGGGASERARELIRRDPSAAAAVLQRWIGSGGTIDDAS